MKTRHGIPVTARLAACAFLAALAVPAIAQYVWLDEKGVKQFSDMPPPASVPASRILKQPGSPRPAVSAGTQDAAVEASPVQTAPTIAEQNAAFRKRQQEMAEKEKKAAEQSKLAADKAKNCDRARDYLRMLESGERITHTDQSGERSFLTDEQRSREIRDARQALSNCSQ